MSRYYISVDPATTKKKKSDYTVMLVHEVLSDSRWVLIDGVRDKLNVEERIDTLFKLVDKHTDKKTNQTPIVTYETIGFQLSDVQNIDRVQKERQKFFIIREVKTTSSSKEDRIRALQPLYYNKRIVWKKSITYRCNWDGKVHDLIQEIKLEYLQFPFSTHDDILDCQSQLLQIKVIAPEGEKIETEYPETSPIMLERKRYEKELGENRLRPRRLRRHVIPPVFG